MIAKLANYFVGAFSGQCSWHIFACWGTTKKHSIPSAGLTLNTRLCPKRGPAATEPLAVASGIKTQPTVITERLCPNKTKLQSKSSFQLESLSRSYRDSVKTPATARPLLKPRRGYDLQPRVAASATPGREEMIFNRKAVAPFCFGEINKSWRNRVAVEDSNRHFPQGSRATRQPWAGGGSPFGAMKKQRHRSFHTGATARGSVPGAWLAFKHMTQK